MNGIAIGEMEVATGEDGGNHKSPGFNAIWNNPMARAVELLHAMNANCMRASAFNFCAHLGEQGSQIDDFRLPRSVFHDCLALSKCCGHHQVFSAGDGDLVKNNVSAVEAAGAGFNVAVFLLDRSAQAFQAFDVEIDRPGADGAATRLGDTGAPGASKQRTKDQRGSAHGLYQFISSFRVDQVAAGNRGAMGSAAVT